MILIVGLALVCKLQFLDHNMQNITINNIPAKILYKTNNQSLVQWDESIIQGMYSNQLINDEFLLQNCKEKK